MSTKPTDAERIALADDHAAQERLIQAATLLRTVEDKTRLTKQHEQVLRNAQALEQVVKDLNTAPGPEWSRQGESHGRFDTMIYYQINECRLTARLETPIDPDLLVPLLSVFNETQLFETWMPQWKVPIRLGVRRSEKLCQYGRCGQRMVATTDLPWPLQPREAVIDVVVADEIDTTGAIVAKMWTPVVTANDDDNTIDPNAVPPVEDGCVRIDFDGGMLFRPCPRDHVALKTSKPHRKHTKKDDGEPPLILCCVMVHVDAHVSVVPISLINFVTRTVLGRMWGQTMAVAQEVRNGQRPAHAAAIQARRDEVYDFIADRVTVMVQGLAKEGANDDADAIE